MFVSLSEYTGYETEINLNCFMKDILQIPVYNSQPFSAVGVHQGVGIGYTNNIKFKFLTFPISEAERKALWQH
jgi:hypothetical protein